MFLGVYVSKRSAKLDSGKVERWERYTKRCWTRISREAECALEGTSIVACETGLDSGDLLAAKIKRRPLILREWLNFNLFATLR